MSNKWGKRGTLFVGIVIALIWLYPLYIVVVNSFKTKNEIFTNTLGLPQDFTFQNYKDAYIDLDFLQSFMNSLVITVVSVIVLVFFSSMAAYALSRNTSKLSGLIYFLFAIALLIPFQAIMIPLVSIFGKIDMLNRVGLIFMYLGIGSGSAIFLYYGALRSISKSLDEAATIDGCNKFQVFWYIIFPMLKPTTITVIVLKSIWFWNDYLLPSLVINKEGTYTIPLKMFYFFGEFSKQWHLALAGLVLTIIPVVIMYMFLQKHIIKGISDGAVK